MNTQLQQLDHTASQQWATRPNDERYLTLEDLRAAVEQRKTESWTAQIKPADQLRSPTRGFAMNTQDARTFYLTRPHQRKKGVNMLKPRYAIPVLLILVLLSALLFAYANSQARLVPPGCRAAPPGSPPGATMICG